MARRIAVAVIVCILLASAIVILLNRNSSSSQITSQNPQEQPQDHEQGHQKVNTQGPFFDWKDNQLKSLEWEGKTASWILERKQEGEDHPTGDWSINGTTITTGRASSLLEQIHSLPIDGTPRKTSALSNGVIESTLTVTFLPDDKQIVYQLLTVPDRSEQFWIVQNAVSMAYPVSKNDCISIEQSAKNNAGE